MPVPQIVVGVDGSEGSKRALRWALEEAQLRGAEVLAVYAWMLVPAAVPDLPPTLDWESLQDSARDFLEEFVAAAADEYGDVVVSPVVTGGPAAAALVGVSHGAELLVVGSRGLGGFGAVLLGSVSAQCVQHATCPVVVIHRADVTAARRAAEREAVLA